MLPKEENDLITGTSRSTPMGELMRRYWLPALLSEEIPAPDSPPAQVRLLGEELVAFRDTEGRIGLLAEHCAHRGASLLYARNEECGLRCIYHGWKYDVEGKVLDTPAEHGSGIPDPYGHGMPCPYKPGSVGVRHASPSFKDKIHQLAYPCQEAGGIIWAYLGPKDRMPLFAHHAWMDVPSDHTYVTKSLLECSYLQGLEGECDTAHLSYLHSSAGATGLSALSMNDGSPVYEVEETDFGLRLLAFRESGPDQTYLRVSSFVMPISCWVPAGGGREVHMYVPASDTTAWRYDFGFNQERAVRPDEVHRRTQTGPDYRRIRTRANHYLQDREVQRTTDFTGIEDYLNEDGCATETMGAIYDRSREHLGVSDKAVIAVRRYLLDAIRRVAEGQDPPALVTDPARNHFPHLDTIARVLPKEGHWREHVPHLTLTAPADHAVTSRP